jgi:hypothetical protein
VRASSSARWPISCTHLSAIVAPVRSVTAS